MREQPGFELDREVWRLVFGEASVRVPPFSIDNASADLLLWRLAQSGVAFKVQELDDVHYCMLWSGAAAPRPGLATGSAGTRPLAICRAVLRLWEVAPLRSGPRPSGGPRPPRTSA
jgi:hypothetical protein